MLETKDSGGAREATGTVVLRAFEQAPYLPLHHQVRNDLTEQLRTMRWAPGSALPGEAELCRHYGVSRGTMRRALDELAREGLIERYPGRGSFIRRPKLEGHIAGSYQQFRLEGPPLDPGGKVLSFQRRPATAEMAENLSIEPRTPVFRLERLRFVRGMPVTIQTSTIPEAICPGLPRDELAEKHLIDIIRERHGLEFTRADELIEPGLAGEASAAHLTVAPDAPVFLLERRTYLADGRIGEFRRAVMRGDVYRYKVEYR